MQSQLSQPLSVTTLLSHQAEEGLMIDQRCQLKPAEHVDRKLHSLLGDRFAPSAGHSDVRMVSRRAK